MGSKEVKESSSTQIAPVGQKEARFRDLLLQIGQGAAGQLGDLSGYADGSALKLTQEDLDLIAQAVGSRTSMATGELRSNFASQNAELEAMLGSTGTKDSSIELVKRIVQQGEQARGLTDIQLQGQAMGAEYGMQLPFQRANSVFGANTALLARLSAGSPALESMLRERMANVNTKGTQTQTGFDPSMLTGFIPRR